MERERQKEKDRELDRQTPHPPFGPSVPPLCHPCVTTAPPQAFTIFETSSATAFRGNSAISWYVPLRM